MQPYFVYQQPTPVNGPTQDAAPVENGTDSKPSEDNAIEKIDNRNSKETGEDGAKYAAGDDLDKRKSPELPFPELSGLPDLPSPNDEDKRENGTDDEGQFTPSGTLSRHGNLDE